MERNIFDFKLMEEMPGNYSVPNQGHRLKLLIQLFLLNKFTEMFHTKRVISFRTTETTY